MARQWKLGEDLNLKDNLLDEIRFEELITTVRCNCKEINHKAVGRELKNILDNRIEDMEFLLRKNMQIIIEEVEKGRS